MKRGILKRAWLKAPSEEPDAGGEGEDIAGGDCLGLSPGAFSLPRQMPTLTSQFAALELPCSEMK